MAKQSWTFKDEEFKQIWDRASPFTMTTPERGYALYLATRYVIENQVPGVFVECGVWRGGSAMIILLTLKKMGVSDRELVLFDTFDGMTEPSEFDYDHTGVHGSQSLQKAIGRRKESLMWAVASEQEVRANIASCGYAPNEVRLVPGDVCQTLSKTQTGPIALLHLDTDFYASTKAELTHLFPRVSQDGVVLIDDYGHWAGARKAVDEYFSEKKEKGRIPLLQPIDYTGRIFVKTEAMVSCAIQRYDYVPPGLIDPQLQKFFPLEAVDPATVGWQYLRYRVPHIWRIDRRASSRTKTGVLSVEEAVLLHNLAKPFCGRRALEIGCHFAWSTAHLLAAGLRLDVVDPALRNATHRGYVEISLSQIEGGGSYNLSAGYSPSAVQALQSMQPEPWSFIFIDGNHDRPAPRLDAEVVLANCAPDAMVVFHDLVSPDVAEGLRLFKERGWRCRAYNTMQIMGVAWQGNVEPVRHVPDPNVPGIFHAHLADFETERPH